MSTITATVPDTRVFHSVILYPTPGKEDIVATLFSTVLERAKKDIPGFIQTYEYTAIPTSRSADKDGNPVIVLTAVYTDEPSADAFGTLPYFLEFLGTVLLDGLFAKPFDEYNCKLFAGFEKEQVLPAR